MRPRQRLPVFPPFSPTLSFLLPVPLLFIPPPAFICFDLSALSHSPPVTPRLTFWFCLPPFTTLVQERGQMGAGVLF